MQNSALLQILDLARWAPSGDNTQPWRFEPLAEDRFVIHGRDTRDHVVYDLDGHPSQISLGALIETAAIAASAHGLALQCQRDPGAPETHPRFEVRLVPQAGLVRSPLLEFIPQRRVQRRPMPTTPLTPAQRQALQASVGPGYRLHFLETPAARAAMARLLFASAKIRLTIPEAFEVHRSIIEWNARFSRDRVPSAALGVDALNLAMMRFALQGNWQRVHWLNRYAGATVMPRLLMDWLPAVRCAAHVAILADTPPSTMDDYVAGGRAMQRFWLTATSHGLNHQPEVTPLIFGRYVREGRRFSSEASAWSRAERLVPWLDRLLDGQSTRAVWLGRLGGGPPASARSERLSLEDLMVGGKAR